jgi:hypothetical protein
MTDRELLQQALDVMLAAIKAGDWKVDGACDPDYVLEAIRARLEQPEPEPVAWFMEGTFEDGAPSFTQVCETDPEFYVPLYTAPPQREWQGLTEEDVWELVQKTPNFSETVAAVEAKLKEKNSAT